jgi:hypothetical protein
MMIGMTKEIHYIGMTRKCHENQSHLQESFTKTIYTLDEGECWFHEVHSMKNAMDLPIQKIQHDFEL